MSTFCSFEKLPRRLFVDSSVLQRLQSYGEFIYDGGLIKKRDRIWSIPDGIDNIEALRRIMFVGKRSLFELVVSENSLREVRDSGQTFYLTWAYEVLGYWLNILTNYADHRVASFSKRGKQLERKLETSKFGYLSTKDYLLIRDAVLLECQAFITMDTKLEKNAIHNRGRIRPQNLVPSALLEIVRAMGRYFCVNN